MADDESRAAQAARAGMTDECDRLILALEEEKRSARGLEQRVDETMARLSSELQTVKDSWHLSKLELDQRREAMSSEREVRRMHPRYGETS